MIVDNPDIDFSKIAKTINDYLYGGPNREYSFYAGSSTWNAFGGLVLAGPGSNYKLDGSVGGNFEGNKKLSMGSNYSSNASGNGIVQSGTLDLSSTSLEEVSFLLSNYAFKLPSSLKKFTCNWALQEICFADGTLLSYLNFDATKGDIVLDSLRGLYTLPATIEIARNGLTSFSYLLEKDTLTNNYLYDVSKVTSLTLGHWTGTGSANIESLEGIERCSNLTKLNIRRCLSLNDMNVVTKLSNLTSLSLSLGQGEDFTSVVLADGDDVLSNLTSLTITSCSGIKKIIGMDRISGLTSISITGTSISDLTGLSNQTGLTSLTLNNNKITNLSEFDELIAKKRHCVRIS